MSEKFCNLFIKDGDMPVFCYRSGLTVYEEGFRGGNFNALGYNGAGFTLDVLEDMPSYFTPGDFLKKEAFSVDVNGVTCRNNWKYEYCEQHENDNGSIEVRIKLSNTVFPIVAYVCTIIDGTAILTRHIEIENLGNDKLNISNVTVMAGGLDKINRWHEFTSDENADKLFSLGYFTTSQHMQEGAFKWHDLPSARQTIESRFSRDRFRHPMFMIKNNVYGSIWFAQLAYSGGYAFDIDFDNENKEHTAKLSFTCRIVGENPTYVLEKNGKFISPALHIGMMNASMDDIINEMHDHTRKSVFTIPHALGMKGGWLEGGMGPERTMDIKACKSFCDTFAYIGAETFIIDAGWYCPKGLATKEWSKRVGTWNYAEDLYPNGFDEIREYAHSKGLLFGLWMEPERAGVLSEIWEKHPDWYITKVTGEKDIVLDCSKPEVIEFIESSISHLVDDYKIDVFRLDYNISYSNMHYFNEKGENGIYRYYENVCAMFDRLRKKYPNVVFENCASGGARTDLQFVKNFDHTWVTDENKLPVSVLITNGMTMVLPPEYVDRLCAGMFSHEHGTLDCSVRNTIFGRPTANQFNSKGSCFNTKQLDFVKHTFDIYKNVIRPFAPTGKIYHHTPEIYATKPQNTVILERCASDKSAGVIGVFRLVLNPNESTVVYPKGIDMSACYEVTFDNSGATVKLSGYEMANNGIKVNVPTQLSSELIIYKKI
ncbi:MAG: hypothetical protein E7353_04200 [Clostridiales bacterium]|nr:hypothetical protein [Clostridiales bacterium]